MYKAMWIIVGICIFISVTFAAVSVENPNLGRHIRFTNVNLAVRNSNSEVVNKTITYPNSVNVQTTTVTSTEVAPQSTVYTSESTVLKKPKKYSTVSQSESSVALKGYKNIDDSRIDEVLKNSHNMKTEKHEYGEYIPKYKTKTSQKDSDSDYDPEYGYDNIDWSRWKSNFVNRILDDSLSVSELDKYPNGAFFYYSFDVDYQGRISNIKVKSLYLSEEDKQVMRRFIKSYEYSRVTKFPPKTNRKTASVSAIMMLSSKETIHSKPSDFNDTERVKYQIK